MWLLSNWHFAPRIIDVWTKEAWSIHLVQPPSLDKQRSGHITSRAASILTGSTAPPFTLSIPFACSPCPLPVAPWEVSADLSQLSHICFLYPDTAVWRPSPEVTHTSVVTQFPALGDRDRGLTSREAVPHNGSTASNSRHLSISLPSSRCLSNGTLFLRPQQGITGVSAAPALWQPAPTWGDTHATGVLQAHLPQPRSSFSFSSGK